MRSVLFALLICPVFCFSQIKGDNTISFHSNNINNIKSVLFNNGYTLVGSDTTYLSTSSKQIEGSAISLKIIILRKDSTTFIKGLIKPVVSLQLYGTNVESDFSDLVFKGGKNSPIRKVWNEMDKIAKQISPNVEYAKQ